MNDNELRLSLVDIGWSQAELARRTGYSPNTVTRWLQGNQTIPYLLEVYLAHLAEIRRLALSSGVIKR